MAAAVTRSVHQYLGGGSVADVLLWRNRSASIAVFSSATALWILFQFLGYSPLSLAANSLLLLFVIVFFWAKSAALLNRPLPPIPNLEISEEVVEKVVVRARVWINLVLFVARDIAVENNRKTFLQVILGLWVVSYVGSFFSFFSVLYIGIVLLFTIPALYEKYQQHVDKKFGFVLNAGMTQYDRIFNKNVDQAVKGKKTE